MLHIKLKWPFSEKAQSASLLILLVEGNQNANKRIRDGKHTQ